MHFFDPRYKLRVHILQIVLVNIVVGISVPQLFLKGQPRTRANTIALGMGAKSIIIISYQILTEHFARFSRWRSYKAYAILNGLEIVFWTAVVFLVIQANIQRCQGISCTLRWIAASVSIVVSIIAVYVFVLSYKEFRVHRMPIDQQGGRREIGDTDVEYARSMESVYVKPGPGTIQKIHASLRRDHGQGHPTEKAPA